MREQTAGRAALGRTVSTAVSTAGTAVVAPAAVTENGRPCVR
jgi:hypothetical protein